MVSAFWPVITRQTKQDQAKSTIEVIQPIGSTFVCQKADHGSASLLSVLLEVHVIDLSCVCYYYIYCNVIKDILWEFI